MKQRITEKEPREEGADSQRRFEQYRSVEFSIDGVECPHQFRIWNPEPASIFVLVREDSEILRRLKVGDIMKAKYYMSDAFGPIKYMDTEISHITKENEGRFKGHCLVGLAISDG
ncbi:MAG: hypothetical protein PVG99_01455 [Desulfobacteraceae bacterium]|jgi:hypothetical protein